MTQKTVFVACAALGIATTLFSCKKKEESDLIKVSIDGNILYVHPTDNSAGYAWADQYVHTGATSLTDGKQNTAALENLPETYASKICSQLNAFGYSDWYLPSKDELVGIALNMDDKSSFSEGYYWSSTELDDGVAWAIYMPGGNTGARIKNAQYPCRCVRKD